MENERPPERARFESLPPALSARQGPSAADLMRWTDYYSRRREPVIAVLLDAMLPGVGNLYAGAPLHALITWGGFATSFLLLWWHTADCEPVPDDFGCMDNTRFALGFAILPLAYLYGIISAGVSAARHNRNLMCEIFGSVEAGLAHDTLAVRF